jgi:UPF0755 protein
MPSTAVKKMIAWLVALIIFIGTVGLGFVLGFNYILSQNTRFSTFDKNTVELGKDSPGAVMIVIRQGADTSDIATELDKKKVIKNKFAFIFMSKLNGFDGQYKAGTHFVKKDMSYDEIMYKLCLKPQTVSVTFPEGLTYKQVKEKLVSAGVLFDEKILDNMVNNPSLFLEYDFVTQIEKNDGRQWLLQGYLFPDTYEFDMNTNEESIIRTFLNNTERRLIPELYARAKTMKLTMDEVITLASVVQAECGRVEEMDLVASVFHNRLNARNHGTGKRLESDATLNYIKSELGMKTSLSVSSEDQKLVSPYNTYLNQGLPAGPICSPGMDAIRGTLWPSKTGYFYFVSKNDKTGANAYARTQNEHFNNVNKYLGKR